MLLELEEGEFVEWEGRACVTMLGLQAVDEGPESRIIVAAMRITDRAVYHYPGDVVYPRSSWRIAGYGYAIGVLDFPLACRIAWDEGPGRRFRDP
jgi:hypothetical protein